MECLISKSSALHLHFNARRVVGVKPPHATGARAGVPVPSGGGYSGFPLPDCATATCSWRYGFAGRPSNRSHGRSARRGGLFPKKKNTSFPLAIPAFQTHLFKSFIMLTIMRLLLLAIRKNAERFGQETPRIPLVGEIYQIFSTALAFWKSSVKYRSLRIEMRERDARKTTCTQISRSGHLSDRNGSNVATKCIVDSNAGWRYGINTYTTKSKQTTCRMCILHVV